MSCERYNSLSSQEQAVKAEKCEFCAVKVYFLGFVISTGSIQMDLEKTKVVVD